MKSVASAKSVNPYDLLNAYTERAENIIGTAAGVGRSAFFVSKKEAKNLPESFQGAYEKTRGQKETALEESKALEQPFPNGDVNLEHAYKHLSLKQVRAAERIVRISKLTGRLEAALEAVKKAGGKLVVGDLEIHDAAAQDIEVDGTKLYGHGSDQKLAIRQGDDAVVLSWTNETYNDGPSNIQTVRHKMSTARYDPHGYTFYEPPGTSVYDRIDRSPKSFAKPKAIRPDNTQLLKRYGRGVDVPGLGLAAQGVMAATGKDPERRRRARAARRQSGLKQSVLLRGRAPRGRARDFQEERVPSLSVEGSMNGSAWVTMGLAGRIRPSSGVEPSIRRFGPVLRTELGSRAVLRPLRRRRLGQIGRTCGARPAAHGIPRTAVGSGTTTRAPMPS